MKLLFLFTLLMFCIYSIHGVAKKAHSHGVAEMNISVEKNEISAELEVPSDDVLGFEHAPKTDTEKKKLKETLDSLQKNFSPLHFPDGNKCEIKNRNISKKEDAHGDHGHSEFEMKVVYNCQTVGNQFEVKAFDFLPTLKKINVQFVNEEEQKSFEAKPKSKVLKIK